MHVYKTVLNSQGQIWLDVVDPTSDELQKIARQFKLHATSVQDCMDPEHLPKIEKFQNMRFVICRAYDNGCNEDADSVQELTRKVAIFSGDTFLVTLHRVDQPFIAELRKQYASNSETDKAKLLSDLLKAVVESYDKPIIHASDTIERLENETFMGRIGSGLIEDSYYLRRRASVIRRILRMTFDMLPRIEAGGEAFAPYFQDVRDATENMLFVSDELYEKANSLINLHLSLESHRVNEVIRVLTVFSAFFMPLTFIASIYGMNFEFMPELKSQFAYPAVLVVMFLTAAVIYYWFRKRGWLK